MQINLKVTMLSKQSQTEKRIHCMVPFIYDSKKSREIYSERKQLSSCLEQREQRIRRRVQGAEENFVRCVHFYDCFDHFRHYTYVKTYQIVKFKYVQFIMSNLSKNKEREKTFPVCSFWFRCGECTEKGRRSQPPSGFFQGLWQRLLIAEAHKELRDICR